MKLLIKSVTATVILTILLLVSRSSFSETVNYAWAKSIGGSMDDKGKVIKTDHSGNIYVLGHFNNTIDFDPSTGVANLTNLSGTDMFIAKYDSSGNYKWAKNIGGSPNNVTEQSMELDAFGNIYVSGNFSLTLDFDPSTGIANLTSASATDIFIAKYDNSGDYVWAKNLEGSVASICYSMFLDSTRNIYITGQFNGSVDFDPSAGIANLTSAGASDIFVAKYDSSGDYVWAKSVGGSMSERGKFISVDASDNVYVVGEYGGTVDFDPGSGIQNLISVSSTDMFVAKYNNSGDYVWAKSISGATAVSISLDDLGSFYLSGIFGDTTDFDPGIAVQSLISAGSADIFLAKFDTSGSYIWSKKMGGKKGDSPSSMMLDPNNNVYITGSYSSDTADFDPGIQIQNLINTTSGLNAMFIAKYDNSGRYLFAKGLENANTSSGSVGNSIAIDHNSNVFVSGIFSDTVDFDAGSGSQNLISAGMADAFFAKYNYSSCTLSNLVTKTGTTLTADESGATYQWIDCGNGNTPISGETQRSFTTTVSGSYAVAVSKNGCSDTSTCFSITTSSGINDNNIQNHTSVYPNPNNGNFVLTFDNTVKGNVEIEVYNLLGAVVYNGKISSSEIRSVEINMPVSESGLYLMQLKTSEGNAISKIMIE